MPGTIYMPYSAILRIAQQQESYQRNAYWSSTLDILTQSLHPCTKANRFNERFEDSI